LGGITVLRDFAYTFEVCTLKGIHGRLFPYPDCSPPLTKAQHAFAHMVKYDMLMMLSAISRRSRALGLAAVVLIFFFAVLYQINNLISATSLPLPHSFNSNHGKPKEQQSLGLPVEYAPRPSDSQWCQDRFGVRFLENIRDSSVNYCDSQLPNFACFWSTTTQQRRDAMCHGRGAIYDADSSKFRIKCQLRSLKPEEIERGVPRVPGDLTRYWYETGPGRVVEEGLVFEADAPGAKPSTTSILVKREGAGNLWHVLMELISLSWTLDALQITIDNATRVPYLSPAAASSTQVIFLDQHEDGPFVEMWKLFAKMPIRRFHELNSSEPATDLIIPLSGGSNTLWQADWVELDCRESALVKSFVSRVLQLYQVPTPLRKNKEVVAKFIRRTNTRKLINETELVESARKTVPHLNIEIVDFATISFAEQLKIVRETDLLIGVHGAGLTHTMFLPPGSAVVEILPGKFAHKGFRNLAQMLGHRYYSTHAEMHGDASGDSQWQFDAVEMEPQQFIHLIDSAARSLYNNGLRSYDIW
jgi:protein O-GlcNAc transferase